MNPSCWNLRQQLRGWSLSLSLYLVFAALSGVLADEPVLTASATAWPVFRGDAHGRGVSPSNLPEEPRELWQFAVPKGSFEGTPAIADGLVFLGDLDGELRAWELATGKLKWEYATETGFIASPAVRQGRVFIGDIDGRVHCVDAGSGKRLWEFETQAEIDGCANFFRDRVLIGSQDATLYCLQADSGALIWKHAIDDQIRCSPTIVAGHAFVAGCDSRLHVIDVEQGVEKSAVEIESPTGVTPAAEGDLVYLGTEAGKFFCVNWMRSQVVWTFETPDRSQAFRSSPALGPDVVVFGGRDKRLHALDKATGKSRWTYIAKARIDGSPVIVGDRVFFGSGDGRLTALRLATGDKVWEREVSGGFAGSAAVADNRLVIASDAGAVYCFGAPAQALKP